MEYEKIDVC
jgi:hypothetical protein